MRGMVADWYAIPLMACGAILIPLSFKRIESVVFAVVRGSDPVLCHRDRVCKANGVEWF